MKHLYVKTLDELDQDYDIIYILDLDSTIFDLTERQLRIFREFSQQSEFQLRYPQETHALENLDREHMSFYPADCIRNFGVSQIADGFEQEFYPFWSERFFSDEYCQYDILEDGAKEFVEALFQKGAHIHYLTGRDVARMGKGTLQSLNDNGLLPQGKECEQVRLVLKPDKKMDDAQFKKDYILSVAPHYHRLVFIDNEPKNLAILKDALEHLHLVHFDSYHMGDTEVPEEAEILTDFLSLLDDK